MEKAGSNHAPHPFPRERSDRPARQLRKKQATALKIEREPANDGSSATIFDEEWLKRRLNDLDSEDLTARMKELITSGVLPSGVRLPTVRALAGVLDISAGSIATVWRRLQEDGFVSTHRRGGTVVLESKRTPATSWSGNWLGIDLSHGQADPLLQPPLLDALAFGLRNQNLHNPNREQITPALRDAASRDWPFAPEAWTAAGGGAEGALLSMEAVAPPGSVVAIEEPTSPRLVEMLQAIGLQAIPVACDEMGPRPDRLAATLARQPVAFIYQPRAQIPLGHSVSEERLRQLADVLSLEAGAGVSVVEDDNFGPLSVYEPRSLGTYLPGRVVHVRTYCKAFGMDLRTCVIGGPSALIDRISDLRSRRYGVNSRILQDALAWLISNPEIGAIINNSRRRYAARRMMLTQALAERGHPVGGNDGVIVWLAVPNETAAMIELANFGITVGIGARCFVSPPPQGYLRIAASRLPDNLAAANQLAAAIVQVISGQIRQEFD